MPRTLIKVGPEHISKGKRNDPNFCPVSYAISDALNIPVGWSNISVACSYVRLGKMGSPLLDTPRSLHRFVKKFDKGEKVEPFNFYLDTEAA